MAFQREVSEIQAREFEVDRQYSRLGLETCAGRAARAQVPHPARRWREE
jgi:hypothetical protein